MSDDDKWTESKHLPTPGRWVMLRWSRDTLAGCCPGFWSKKTRGYQRTADGEQRGATCHPTHWRELTTIERIAFNKPMTCDACDRELLSVSGGRCDWCEERNQKIRHHEKDDRRED